MIERLQVAGYSATELSRMSNINLHATYLEARPLLEKSAAELARVVDRERKRSQRLRAEIAGEQQNRQAVAEYHNWSQSNLPKPIVARRADMVGESMPQNPELEMVTAELRTAKTKYREAEKNMVRFGGPKRLAELEHARKKVAFVEGWMQEVSK
jgi:hypothetical protein